MLYQKQQRAGEGGSPVRVKFSRRSLRSFISEKPAFGGSRKTTAFPRYREHVSAAVPVQRNRWYSE